MISERLKAKRPFVCARNGKLPVSCLSCCNNLRALLKPAITFHSVANELPQRRYQAGIMSKLQKLQVMAHATCVIMSASGHGTMQPPAKRGLEVTFKELS